LPKDFYAYRIDIKLSSYENNGTVKKMENVVGETQWLMYHANSFIRLSIDDRVRFKVKNDELRINAERNLYPLDVQPVATSYRAEVAVTSN
jgi:hypothetical protein